MDLEDSIKIFNEYIKKNKMFTYYRQKVNNFINDHPLSKVLIYNLDKIYSGGDDGAESYLRAIGSEYLMGTRVGMIYSNFPNFFKKPEAFQNFRSFIADLIKIDVNAFRKSFYELIIQKDYFKTLSTLKTVLIQILACYFPKNFLPIYNTEMLQEIIINLGIDINSLDAHSKEKLISNKPENLGEKLFIANENLFKTKNSHKIMQKWDNIMYTHFLFMCLPVKAIQALKDLKIGIQFLDPTNEQFVIGIFLRIFEKLGFKRFTRLKTSYPDAEIETNNGEIKKIEFEYNSNSFISHLELADLCDIIVCWHDDLDLKLYPNFEKQLSRIEIIALEDIMDSNSDLYRKITGNFLTEQ